MDRYGEKPKFEVKDTIDQTPFERAAAGAFFAKWCEVNDSIVPVVVERKEWEEKTQDGILHKNEDGKHTLFLPKDLHLWEMVGVMEAVDTNTFATNPERQKEVKEKMLDLGRTFQKVGVYFAKRKDGIGEGKEIAEALAVELYDYGQSLVSGKKAAEGTTIEAMAKMDLSQEETEEVDHFLAGDSLAEAREKKAKKRGMEMEAMRQKTINQFFGVAQKAFELSDKSALGELKENPNKLEPWINDAPIHETFLAKIHRALERNIEMPKTELHASIFRRGMELLGSSMPFDSLPHFVKNVVLHWARTEKTLRGALGVELMKAELEKVRKSGDLAKITDMEIRMTDRIQRVVSKYQYTKGKSSPPEMILTETFNCLGASKLGSSLLTEVGLKHIVVHLPKHSILFLTTSDDKIMWRDMLSSAANVELKDEMIVGKNGDGTPLKVSDIVRFAKNPTLEGLSFNLAESYRKKFPWVKNNDRNMVVFGPEQGLGLETMHFASDTFYKSGLYEEALVGYLLAVVQDPKDSSLYTSLGATYRKLGYNKEAENEYKKSIALNPNHPAPFDGLGLIYYKNGRYDEAEELLKEGLLHNPSSAPLYASLGMVYFRVGRYEDALTACNEALVLDPKHMEARFNVISVLKYLKRKKEALAAYDEFLKYVDKDTGVDLISRANKIAKELQGGS